MSFPLRVDQRDDVPKDLDGAAICTEPIPELLAVGNKPRRRTPVLSDDDLVSTLRHIVHQPEHVVVLLVWTVRGRK